VKFGKKELRKGKGLVLPLSMCCFAYDAEPHVSVREGGGPGVREGEMMMEKERRFRGRQEGKRE